MSAPFLTGVGIGLGLATAIGDTEAGGVTEGGFLSFFGLLLAWGESPPVGCVCGE